MLPTRGTCHGVFLLTHSARIAPRRSVSEWVSFARGMPTVMAAAIDLDVVASFMCERHLASFAGGQIVLNEQLAAVEMAATDEVLMTIAGILLEAAKPPWIHTAVTEGRFHSEFVPFTELTALKWMGEDIEPLLIGLKEKDDEDDKFKTWLGSIGELFLAAAERETGASVRHVSLISDYFGYDIESRRPARFRFEVKTSIAGRESRVFLTRNEVTAAGKYLAEWALVQVVLKPEALTAEFVTRLHVLQVRILPSSAVLCVLPNDSQHCRWIETVELKTSELPWSTYGAFEAVSEAWKVAGLYPSKRDTLFINR